MIAIATSIRQARMLVLFNAINAAAPLGGLIKLYTGARPAAGATPIGALQATVELPNPCGTLSDGTLTFTPGAEGQRIADSEITWARMTDGGGVWVMDLDVSASGGGGDMQLSTVVGFTGAFVRITSGVIGE
jgi:hypothetical protein